MSEEEALKIRDEIIRHESRIAALEDGWEEQRATGNCPVVK